MKEQCFFNVLEDFDFKLVDDPEFREDSVREEIILPIVKGLGYTMNKPYQIIRSRKLLHPFVSIGSKRKEIYIIPDYLFEVMGKPAWILDAKSPSEPIIKSSNVEQAYSYAIHSEVRVNFFALCNGREFALYNIEKIDPILHFPVKAIPLYWDNLKRYLLPQNIFTNNHFKLAKDLGLHLKRLGFDVFDNLIFPNVPITHIGQLDPDMFTSSCGINNGQDRYAVTFDFGHEVLNQLVGKIPFEAIEKLRTKHSGLRQHVSFADKAYIVTIDCKIGNKLEENEDEIFLPLWVNKIVE